MWAPGRSPAPQRTPSMHSIVSTHSRPQSMAQSPQIQRQTRGYADSITSDTASENDNGMPPMWHAQRQQSGATALLVRQKMETERSYAANIAPEVPVARYKQHQEANIRPVDDDASSRSSTLDGNEDLDYPVKPVKQLNVKKNHDLGHEPASPAPAPHIPGPLESQLAALMSKLVFMEQSNPSISVEPEEYEEMQARLKGLEEEKKTWWKRHEAIWALRDEDVENNIKIRGMLAKARRDLEGMTKLRDEDLVNVQVVRSRLAEKTRELERLQAQTGRTSPSRGRPNSFFERRGTATDLFTAAKVAALEQRALDLEKRNSDLLSQLQSARSGMSMDDLNSVTAHQAWKSTVSDLESKLKAKDAELARLHAGGASSGGVSMDWYRIEALLEEHAGYRESVGGKLQALRSEKETLQKDLHRKENECQGLELKVQTLMRRVSVL
ncbi:hypothetical protein ACN47E_000413 [Coniothyrium glycines]